LLENIHSNGVQTDPETADEVIVATPSGFCFSTLQTLSPFS